MAKIHTPKIADGVCAQREAVHTQLCRAYPEDNALASLKPEEISIAVLGSQGASKSTFHVKAGSKDFILSVYTPDVSRREKRAPIRAQHILQQALIEGGVPVPNVLGGEFEMQVNGTAYNCELTEFCHGYQVDHFGKLNPETVKHFAKTLALAHRASEKCKPTGIDVPIEVRFSGLPFGYVHNDIHPENVIFNDATNSVAGLIDFERARYRPLVNELGQVAGRFLDIRLGSDKKFTIHMTDSCKDFLRSYAQERPLSGKEMPALEFSIMRSAWKQCKTIHGLDFKERKLENPDAEPAMRRFKLRAAIAEAQLEFRSELSTAMRELKQEMKQGRNVA